MYMCIVKNCKTVKTYNFIGLHPQYCQLHKTDGMINVRHEICTECRQQASFGYLETNIREKCSIHAERDMINLKHKNTKCIGHDCGECRIPQLNGYCSEKCYINNNLQEYIYYDTSGILYKEYLLFKHLKERFTHNIIWNKEYCGLYRPDFRISLNGFTIIIELDEDQHRTYNKQQEVDRIENIYHIIQEPLYVIRFNPDNYNSSCIKIKSPFLNNKLIDEIEWTNRLQYLENTIHNCIETGLSSDAKNTYSIQYLFYNE